MRRGLLLGAAVAAAVALAPGPVSAAPSAAPARLLVTADEWLLILSRQSIARGPAIVQLHGAGEDAHDLAARRRSAGGRPAGRTFRMAETKPGRLSSATWRLRPGTYRVWCTLPGHEAAGMRATLTVR